MPLRDFRCGSCDKLQERFYSPAHTPTCECGGALTMLERSDEGRRPFLGAAFPFTTTHIDPKGRPIEVTSLAHVRQLERDYGVVLSAFSHNPSNLDPIPDPPRYRGHEFVAQRRR